MRALGERARVGTASRSLVAGDEDLDQDRADLVVPTIARLLGFATGAR